ncbi:antibiotic biosynthesis monooxygenase [Ciceribacter sp. L1K23]|uniref:putative quinol monooxygenase n=1 Tax=Ciceribacter sp. L1K23 TaxID=2820276 RepID=UPI001B83B111|nr:antibiotic biosynthesis monooxygenase [Ciceribacter sp. L1K23]MBR0556303.1 antibiotic biosynthesis monooxygenase [Ciceribacter sp. L1K23]
MRIAHLFFSVDPARRAEALALLVAEAPAIRAMKGCMAFMPFADPTTETGLGVLHEWETDADFTAYTGSEIFAETGRMLRPMMSAAPVSRRFDAELVQTVN